MPLDPDHNHAPRKDFEADGDRPTDPDTLAPPPLPDVLKRPGPSEPSRPSTPIPRSSAMQFGRVFAIGMDFVYGVVGCAALGWAIDWWFKTAPRWLLIGAGIGIVVAMYRFIREGMKLSRGDQNRRP
ncbi:MAG: AtpZ/AtpI family protein [Phycisphaeraceae bacterium]|nr:AtpZ/AtpI family protein [Phycisphaeraceae bacterium]